MSAYGSMKGDKTMQIEPNIPPKRERLITRKMAAERLCVSLRTLDRMVSRGMLEKVFLGMSVRFRERDIEHIIEHGA